MADYTQKYSYFHLKTVVASHGLDILVYIYRMDGKWILARPHDGVVAGIPRFVHPEIKLVIKRLRKQNGSILFGCYVPTIPRPTSILTGKILVSRLSTDRTELQALEFQDWAMPFVYALINYLSGKK